MKKVKLSKIVYATFGFIAIGLGCIGIVLPVMPTTPFLLIALFCFTKSSDRFYKWFISSALYKRYLQDFVSTKSMKLKTKISILSMASIVFIAAIILCNILWVRILILVLMAIKYYFFFVKIGTLKENNTSSSVKDISEDTVHSNS